MKILLHALFLMLMMPASRAGEVSYNGTKPAVIIDVRTPQEFAAGHIDGALNIPYEQIALSIQSIKGLNKDSPILLYCRSGHRSAIARASLERQGYMHIVDGGGMETLSKNMKACTAKTC